MLFSLLEQIRVQKYIDANRRNIELGAAKSIVKGSLQHLVNLCYLILTKHSVETCQVCYRQACCGINQFSFEKGYQPVYSLTEKGRSFGERKENKK